MIFSSELLAYTALATAVYLLIVNWALSKYERHLIARGMWGDSASDTDGEPESETQGSTQKWIFLNHFLTQWLLYAALPMGIYGWLYLLLPLEGLRAGISIALWTVAVGALPFAVAVSERHKIPFVAMLFLMFSQVVKLLGTLAIIGFLFSL